MNKAFVKEDDDDTAERLPDRAVSPHPNLVTAEGLGSPEARRCDRLARQSHRGLLTQRRGTLMVFLQ
jgi:hypothetical protein